MNAAIEPVRLPNDWQRLVVFLCEDEWPYHGRTTLSPSDVEGMNFTSASVSGFWVLDEQRSDVGLVRIFDLDDIGLGAPQIDVRVATRHRGRGFGSYATEWLVAYVFDTYSDAHRIEAYTRSDNAPMQQVLAKAGFVCEGTLRDAWWTNDGEWMGSMVYGILRSDLIDHS